MQTPLLTKPELLKDELHCHLYGCLTPEDLWSLGRDRYEIVATRLEWYADEFARAYGYRPNPFQYWTKDSGIDLLRRDFLFTSPNPFSRFQASFNLAIALLPITPIDTTVLRHVLKSQATSGMDYCEYRLFVPPHLNPEATHQYLATSADTTIDLANELKGTLTPKLVFSIMRKHELGLGQYEMLRTVLEAKPERYEVVVGIDFCGVEEHHPPQITAPIVQRILADNTGDPSKALAVLYHVGESFTDKSLTSAVRWVGEANAMGVHRLGHALALGIEPDLYLGHTVTEAVGERRRHLQWLLANDPWLSSSGYHGDNDAARHELKTLESMVDDDHVTTSWTEQRANDCRSLQNAVMLQLKRTAAIIESCPTSNMLIGNLTKDTHPLPRFLAGDLNVVIGADDPGIFATSLAREESRLKSEFFWTKEQLTRSQNLARQSRSVQLVRQIGSGSQ